MTIDNICNEIYSNIKTNVKHRFNYYKNKINPLTKSQILQLIAYLCDYINEDYVDTYKKTYYKPIGDIVINIIIEYDIELYDINIISLIELFRINNVVSNIYKIESKLINSGLGYKILTEIIYSCSFSVFSYLWNLFKNKYKKEDLPIFLMCAIKNSDDRILKYILDDTNGIYITDKSSIDQINILLSYLYEANHIPDKYKLKRIKILSTKYDLTTKYDKMLTYSGNLHINNKLSKYYYKNELSFNTLYNMIYGFTPVSIEKYNDCKIFYDNLYTVKEKCYFALLCFLNGFYNSELDIKNLDYLELVQNNYSQLIHIITTNYYIYIEAETSSEINKTIFKNLIKNKLFEKYFINCGRLSNKYLLWYTKYFVWDCNIKLCSEYNIKVNKALFMLRCLLKKRYKHTCDLNKIRLLPILSEMNNVKFNNRLLRDGSIQNQLKKQKFNKIPPRNLLPMENIKNKKMLFKEKADGILTYILPSHIYPNNNELFKYEIKAEYIEKLDLYLIFDINIPNMSILDRQYYLRNLHPYTKNDINNNNILTKNELLLNINKENDLLSKFIDDNLYEIKWYPKQSWEVYINEEIHTLLIDIIMERDLFFMDNRYECDGIILTPLDGCRELKVKPKFLQTVDLLYTGTEWLDGNNNNYTNIITNDECIPNSIYKCYPENTIFKPKEVRLDKTKPNTQYIIDMIQSSYNFNWDNSLVKQNKNYYEEPHKIYDSKIINILKTQKDNLYNILSSFEIKNNKNWLDLGCGKSKIFTYLLNKYYPNKYLGMDNDTSILNYNLVDIYQNTVSLYPCDLSVDWNVDIWGKLDWSIKYNYIIINFSIMHFNTILFWEQLDKITQSDSIIFINIVKPNYEWKYKNSYLISDNKKTKYKFEWIHNSEHEENIVYPIFNNWSIIKEFEFNDDLIDCYKWYVLQKKS